MISKAIRIKRNEIFSVLKILKEMGIMDERFKIKKENEYAYIPIKFPIDGYEIFEIDFEEIRRKNNYMDFLKLPEEIKNYLPRSMDIVGNIAIIKLNEHVIPYSNEIAQAIMKFKKNIKTVANDKGVKGEFRVRDLEIIGGNGLETIHTENGIKIYVDLAKVYFSPRLSTERARILSLINDNEIILDLFCGVGSFSLLIGKKRKVKIYAIDKNPFAISCLKKSIEINKISNVVPILGDIRDVIHSIPNAKRAIVDLPLESLNYIDLIKNKAKIFHIYYKTDSPNKVKEEIEKQGLLVKNFNLLHGYSPTESMYVFDAIKVDNNDNSNT